MPRPSRSGPRQIRLLEQLSLGAVMSTYPGETIKSILNKTGTSSIRLRLLPSFLIIYLVIVLGFYADVSIRETLRIILEELRKQYGLNAVKVGVGSAITKARKRIGFFPLKELFNESVHPIQNLKIKNCYWRGELL